jgi:sialate O-acetylesterase
MRPIASIAARLVLGTGVLAVAVPAAAEVTVPAVIGSHMVLQRDTPVPVWGWAAPGEEVAVTLDARVEKTKADAQGAWKVTFPPLTTGGDPHTLTVAGANTLRFDDILVGDVWVGSGQSNMEWSLAASGNPEETIAAANHPQLRLFHVPKVQAKEPARDVKAAWKACTPEAAKNFSAVLYHFGVKLQGELEIPIGLINSSWGGSPIEPWTVHEGKSGGMYNGMIAPLVAFPVRGFTWYQGETNVLQKNGHAYVDKMRNLIGGWRRAWGNDQLPFYYVQIAPWQGRYEADELCKLWEAQAAALEIPGTGMVVTTDLVDNIKDIHPKNKLDVGQRLARWALAKTYGQSGLVYSGPLFRSVTADGSKLRLSFAHAKGLTSRDGAALTEFEVAGPDGKFVPATATVDGETVVVSAVGIAEPKLARFGWRSTATPNLVNGDGLPASPFQTDGWRGGTGE